MATSTTICGPCSERYTTKPSAYWCSDCQEAICDDCQEHHKVLKVTRSHELIPIDKYKSLPSFITDIQQSCTNHNEKYLQYCVAHALPICFKCIKEHQKCNVIPLDEVTSNAKTSDQLQDLEARLVDLLQNIDRIEKDRKSNLGNIEDRKERHLEEIQQIRKQINESLDKLEKEIKQDLEKQECQCKNSILKILKSVEEKKNLITQYQTNLQKIKEHATNLQTFLVMRDIEVNVFENEQFLQSLIETKQIEQIDLVIKVNPELLSISNSLKKFGTIEIQTASSNIGLIRANDKQAQLQIKSEKTINNLKLILQKQITTDCENVRGCCMSVNGDYFFTDYGRKMLNVISSDGTFKYKMLLDPNEGFDMTIIDKKTIAITSGDSFQITGIDIIDTESQEKMKFISLPGRPCGITCNQDSLFVCVEGRGIYKFNTVDYSSFRVISCKLPLYTYVSIFDDKIYYTNIDDDSVVCCDHNGSRVWSFNDTSVLKTPRGVTVDTDGNVFVVGETSTNVVIISDDGKFHREILTAEDGLSGPSAIFFDKQIRKLFVANTEEIAFLYSVN